MRIAFYKSLDREFELFGIRGRWVVVVLVGIGLSLLLALMVGGVLGTGTGIAVGAVGAAVAFFGTVTVQVKTPSRRLGKAFISPKAKGWVVRRETVARILLDDPRYAELKKELEFKSNHVS